MKKSKSKSSNTFIQREIAATFRALAYPIKLQKEGKSAPGLRNIFRVIQNWPLRKYHLGFMASKFNFTQKQMAAIAGISTRTYQRWKPNTKLSSLVAESIFKLADLYDNGLIVFNGDEKSFLEWMRVSVPALNHEKPTDLLDTTTGMELVINELLRMEYGVI